MSDDFDIDEDELPEEMRGKKLGVIKATEKIGKAFIGLLKDFEDMNNRVQKVDGDGRKNLENVLTVAVENSKVTLNRDFYAMPFALMHRMQKFPEEYDDYAKQLCAVLSADLLTLKALTDNLGETLKELNEHMTPILKKKEREARRKEGSFSAGPGSETAGEDKGPQSNILDFAERRGRVRDKPRSTTYH